MTTVTLDLPDDVVKSANEYDLLAPESMATLLREEVRRRLITERLPEGVTPVFQPDGSYQLFAMHPQTQAQVEIDPDQVWFWTKDWQSKEAKADADIQAGKVETFEDMDSFIDSL